MAQAWAGAHWGAIFLPRVGQEVLVDFLQGDPDQPIITGAVYNASHMPPYELPGHATRSGIKSRSTSGGTLVNGNEIRFEDLAGHEDLFIGAEKTQTTLVKGCQSLTVGVDRTATVTGSDAVTVGRSRTVHVKGHGAETVDGNRTERVGGTLRALVGGDRIETVSASVTTTVARDTTMLVGGATRVDLGGPLHVIASGRATHLVGGNLETRVGGAASYVYASDARTVVGHPDREASVSTFVYGGSATTLPRRRHRRRRHPRPARHARHPHRHQWAQLSPARRCRA